MPEHLNLPNKSDVFKKTYINYLNEISKVDLKKMQPKLGIKFIDKIAAIPFFNTEYLLKEKGFVDAQDRSPSFDILIVLCKYLLLCPDSTPKNDTLVSFRDFKHSGPLTTYFSNDVEARISRNFEGKLESLKRAVSALKGFQPKIDVNYDFTAQIKALPNVPMVLLFNDKDDEFDAQAKLLFEQRAEKYLDAECLAIMGNLLSRELVKKIH